jgi:hypothetical protein
MKKITATSIVPALALAAVFGLAAIALARPAPAWAKEAPGPIPRGFVLGISQGAEKAAPFLEELGIGWTRIAITLNELTPEVLEPRLRLADVLGNTAKVRELSARCDWRRADRRIADLLARGIRPIPIVGHGYKQFYARVGGKPAHPDRLGRDHYLAQMYWSVRATVERYDGDGIDDAPGLVLKVWQLENELNQAGLTAAWGWREPGWVSGLGSAWSDWGFLTELLRTLHRAAKDADPQALTFMNFHTDVPDNISRLARAPGWLEAVRRWKGDMEIVGFDSYPNYYVADPVRGEAVGEVVRKIKAAAPGMPVWGIEIDYPSGPAERGFTPEKQAQFLRESFDAARAAGADGYFKFHVTGDDTHDTEITPRDLQSLATVVPLWESGRLGRLFCWALLRPAYVKNHFLDLIRTVEGYWGMIGPTGAKKPAYFTMQEIVREVNQTPTAAGGGGE